MALLRYDLLGVVAIPKSETPSIKMRAMGVPSGPPTCMRGATRSSATKLLEGSAHTLLRLLFHHVQLLRPGHSLLLSVTA